MNFEKFKEKQIKRLIKLMDKEWKAIVLNVRAYEKRKRGWLERSDAVGKVVAQANINTSAIDFYAIR